MNTNIKMAKVITVTTARNAQGKMLKKMERVEALSRIQANPYKYVHDWFVNEFPNYNSAATEYNFEELSATSQANLPGAAI